MKTTVNMLVAGIIGISMIACQQKNTATETTGTDVDSKEVAQDSNTATFQQTDLKEDAQFAVNVADGSRLEVELGALATANGSDRVKQFGQMMVEDHTKANAELKELAIKKGIALPEVLSDDSKRAYDSLSTKQGADFDEAFMKKMVKDHRKTIRAFKDQAENGKDPDLRSWASGKLVTLQHHLDMAEQLQNGLKK